jgi:site-specific DNA recombinase
VNGTNIYNGKRAVLYIRVSTDEQLKNNSLPQQEGQLGQWCENNGAKQIKLFREHHSAKDFNRPEWKKLLEYVKDRSSKIDLVLVTRLDRFSRSLYESLTMLQELKRSGVRVHAIEQPIDERIPESIVIQALNLALPEADNLRRSDTITKGMRQGMKDGKWMHRAPKGYVWKRDGKRKWIEPKEPEAHYIQDIFRRYLGGENLESIRKDLHLKFKCSKSQIHLIIRNPVYAGKIRIPEWYEEPERIVQGLHDPIIPYEQFLRIQDRLSGSKKRSSWNKFNPKYPLKGHIDCPECEKALTGSASTGRNALYSYYHCSKGHIRVKLDQMHSSFAEYLERFSFDPAIIQLLEEELKAVFTSTGKNNKSRIRELEREKDTVVANLENAEEKYIEDKFRKDSYDRLFTKYTRRIQEIDFQIESERETLLGLDGDAVRGVRVLTELSETFQHALPEDKKRIAGSIFPDNLVYENGNFRTARINSVIELVSNIDRASRGSEKEKAARLSDSSRLVHPTGFEPFNSGLKSAPECLRYAQIRRSEEKIEGYEPDDAVPESTWQD